MKVLIIEDEPKVASFIKQGLEEQSTTVQTALDGLQGYKYATENDYDVIIMDLMLPHISGVELCRKIRGEGIQTPVLMLTALNSTDDKVLGFDAGADDYLVKPFEFKELTARLKALNKRKIEFPLKNHTLSIADLILDLDARVVKRAGKLIDLTHKEYALMEYMMRNINKVITRQEISQNVWDISFDTRTNVIDVYINFLRKKIDKDRSVKLIHTVIGMGYVIKEA